MLLQGNNQDVNNDGDTSFDFEVRKTISMNQVIHDDESFVDNRMEDRGELKKHESIILDICNEIGIPEPSNKEIKEEIIP